MILSSLSYIEVPTVLEILVDDNFVHHAFNFDSFVSILGLISTSTIPLPF